MKEMIIIKEHMKREGIIDMRTFLKTSDAKLGKKWINKKIKTLKKVER